MWCESFWLGLELLLGLLKSTSTKQQHDGAVALCKLAHKAMTLSSVDAAPPSPISQVTSFSLILFLYATKWTCSCC